MEENQPVIVRRIKRYAPHHGGAWKVAFADFATAMMAFFLVLWLSASTSQEQKEAIEGYFKDPVGYLDGGAANPIDLGGSPTVVVIEAPQHKQPEELKEDVIDQLAESLEEKRLRELMSSLQEKIDQSSTLRDFKDQLLLDITEEGLRIQIVDQSKRPMFDSGSSELKAYSENILIELARTISQVPNKLSITGHTDAQPYGREDYSNWELSSDRANAARRALLEGGVSDRQVSRVVGLASSVLFDKDNPYAPVNRRIAIIVLYKYAEDKITRNASQAGDSEDDAAKPAIQFDRTRDVTRKVISPDPAKTPKDKDKAMKSLEEGSWFDEADKVDSGDVTW